MNRKVVNNKTNQVIIHAEGIFDDSYSLCGVDLSGDDCRGLSYYEATATEEKITCEQCITIINHCKNISRKEISKTTISLVDWGI